MSVTELELKSLSLRKKRIRRQLGRTELNRHCRAIWRNRRALKREKHLKKIKAPKKHKASISTGVRLQNKKMPKLFSQTSSKTSIQFLWTKKMPPIRETPLGRPSEKLENGLCRWTVDFTKETGESPEQTEKRERVTGSNHSR